MLNEITTTLSNNINIVLGALGTITLSIIASIIYDWWKKKNIESSQTVHGNNTEIEMSGDDNSKVIHGDDHSTNTNITGDIVHGDQINTTTYIKNQTVQKK